jgi:hypothetical protein
MPSRITQIAVVLLAALALAIPLPGAEQLPRPASPDQQILVLRNGQTIEGRITQTEGVYVVDLDDGRIRVKAADVDLVCSSLEEGYRRKRAAIQVGNIHDHLELAQWSLRRGLLGPAAAELADAKTADPKNRMIGVLESRLKMALEPPSPSTSGKSTPGPSNDELDRMIRSLPHGTVESFAQSIQPVLMNHCAAGGCHGPQAQSGLRLFRVPMGKSASRRITQRNLYSVLSFVNRENPLNSRLLTVPSVPHGTSKLAIFNEYQAGQYKRLVDWTNQLAQQPMLETPATLGAAAPAATMDAVPLSPPPRVLSQEARRAHPLAAGPRQTTDRGAAPSSTKPGAEATPASFNQPVDPLDPEAFNRRYAPAKPQVKQQPSQ